MDYVQMFSALRILNPMARTKGKGKAVDAGISPVKKTKRVVQNVGVSSSGPPTKKRKEGETSGVKNVEDGSKSPKGKKLKRKEFAIPNDVKCRRRIKNTEDGPDAKKKTDHPKLKTRTTTSTFFKKLTVLNDAQKDVVRSIGFGHILEFKVNRVPSKLAYWVLDRFNHRSCTLELDVLTKVEIEEDDVYRVYGFPKGNKLIENFERTAENELFIEWMNFFNVANRDKIKIKAVLRRMVDSADGGTWFKRHFVIALCFSLMESCTSGTVHPYIFRALANIEEIKSWNWGEYLLRCLIDHKKSWMADKTKVFGGPTLFLVLFYVDRIQIGRQSVPRGFPIFMQWTGKTLREREDKELDDDFFGGGAVVKPIALPIEYTTDVPTEYGQGGEYRGPVATKLMNDAIVIGEMIRVAREMVQKASDEEKKSQYFKDSLVAASKIIGVTIEVGGKVRDKLPEGLEPETDPFWYTDEVQDAVDAASVETLGNKTRDMPENVDIPSFSLNVTQEFKNAPSNVDGIGGIGAENHEGIGSIVDVAATAEVTEDVTEQNEGPNPRGSGTGIQNDGVMGINITTDKDVVVDGSVNVGHGGMEASLLDAVDGSVNVEQEDIACDIAVAKKLKSAAADDCGSAKDDENLIVANKENAKDQDKDVSDVVVEKIEVRRSNRVKGNFGRDAKKKLMNATTTKSGVDGCSKTNCVVDRLALQAIDTNIVSSEKSDTKTPKKSMFLHTPKFRSPYMQRDISTSKPLQKIEKELGYYAMYLESGEKNEILFSFFDIHVRRFEMLSMRRGNVVNICIVDAWTLVLNWKEQYRSDNSPLRFFATASLYVDSIAPNNSTQESQRASFFMSLYVELNEFGKNPVGKIDMFFFPVVEQNQYFALCVDLKRERIFVLDSLVDISDDNDLGKYESICIKVRTLLAYYLNYKEETIKAKTVANSKIHIVKLKWADKRNTLDTAIYLMRHLETFMGDISSNWKCDMYNAGARQLSRMRVRYCSSIISWNQNDKKKEIQESAAKEYHEICLDPSVNINSLLAG